MRYLARKHDLCGTTPEEVIRTDMLEYQLADMQNAFFDVTYEHYVRSRLVYSFLILANPQMYLRIFVNLRTCG